MQSFQKLKFFGAFFLLIPIINFNYAAEVEVQVEETPNIGLKLSQEILSRVFQSRHQAEYDAIERMEVFAGSSDYHDFGVAKARLDQELSNTITYLSNKKKRKPNEETQLKNAIKNHEKLKNFNLENYKTELAKHLTKEMPMDTVSVLIRKNGDVVVAGNVKTRKLMQDILKNPDYLKLALDFKLTGKGKKPRFFETEMETLGFQDSDYLAIHSSVSDLMGDNVGKLEVLKAKAKGKADLEEAVMKHNSDKSVESESWDKSRRNDKVENHLEELVHMSQATHAEMQILRHGVREGDIIEPSKPPCELCKVELGKHGLESKHEKAGLPDASIKNWDAPLRFEVSAIEITPELLKEIHEKEAAGPANRPTTVEANSCESGKRMKLMRKTQQGKSLKRLQRSKRSLGSDGKSKSGCIFVISEDEKISKKKQPKIEEIRSKEFLEEYSKADNKVRRDLTHAAETNMDKISGNEVEVEKISKLVEYEKMQKHAAKVDYLRNGVKDSEALFTKDGKTNDYHNSELLHNTKLSPTKLPKTMSKGMTKFSKNAGKVSGTIGKYLLAKNIAESIAKGDVTSLEVIGGRVGGEMLLEGLAKFGAPMAEKFGAKLGLKLLASGASKGLKILGKAAGPLGALADIGLSGWSISKSVARLNNPNATKFEQNDAIADIVQDSIDIAITVTVTALSIAFPPFAPLFAVVGFFANLFVSAAVLAYKAKNHVDEVNSKIQLLDWEKTEEYLRYVDGEETPDYIQDLIKVKNANNLVVNASIEFLENNEDYLGRVFPSRTFTVLGGYKYVKQYCTWRVPIFGGCGHWEETEVYARHCFQGGSCENGWTCEYSTSDLNAGYNEYRCEYDRDEETVIGNEHEDSYVDLRSTQTIYIDRSRPDPPKNDKYDFLCLPSSTYNRGYEISERWPTSGRYCEHAIGIERSSGKGKFMLYQLGNGKDTVFPLQKDGIQNLHMVDDGHKKYYGSGTKETFLISGNCVNLQGLLNGNFGPDDVVVFEEKCAPNSVLIFSAPDPNIVEVTTAQGSGDYVFLNILNVETIYGREGSPDHFTVGCRIDVVGMRGGKNDEFRDEIYLQPSSCPLNVTIHVDKYTNIELDRFEGYVLLVIPINSPGIRLKYRNSGMQASAVYYLTGGSDKILSHQLETTKDKGLELVLEFADQIKLEMIFMANAKKPNIIFENEEGTPRSNLVLDDKSNPKIVHYLSHDSSSLKTRHGSRDMSNFFEIEKGSWEIFGGSAGDDFILKTLSYNIDIEGGEPNGKNIQNALYLDPAISEKFITIDGRQISGHDIRLSNIHKFIGRPGQIELITTSCGMRLLAGNSGFSEQSPDIIDTYFNRQCKEDLIVVASGFTEIIGGHPKLTILIPEGNNGMLNTEMKNVSDQNSRTAFFFQFPIAKLNSAKLTNFVPNEAFTLEWSANENQRFRLDYSASDDKDSSDFFSQPSIMFNTDSNSTVSFLINKNSGQLLAYHQLFEDSQNNNSPIWEKGSRIMANHFQVSGGNYNLLGGELDDTFELCSSQFGTIDGLGGENALVLCQNLPMAQIQINFLDQSLFMDQFGSLGNLRNIQKVHGRRRNQEHIVTNCDTTLIALNGGISQYPDQIIIPKNLNCHPKTNILANGISEIFSNVEFGSFQIFVQPDFDGELSFKSTFKITTQINSTFIFRFHVKEILSIDSKMSLDQILKIDFQLTKRQKINLKFSFDKKQETPFLTNPQIIFSSDEEQAQLLIDSKSGSTFLVHAITESQPRPNRKIFGAPSIPNVFNLVEGNSIVMGGQAGDTFILHSPLFSGTLMGGGGLNTLIVDNDLEVPILMIDLENNVMNFGVQPNVGIFDISIVKGREGKSDHILTNCGTKFLSSGGGSNENNSDEIRISGKSCDFKMNLTIELNSFTTVENLAQNGSFIYQIKDPRVVLNIEHPESTQNYFRFQYGIEMLQSAEIDENFNLILKYPLYSPIKINGIHHHKIQFHSNLSYYIRSEISWNNETKTAITKTFIDGCPKDDIQGLDGTDNEFFINPGSDCNLKKIKGGNLKNVFWLISAATIESLDGGIGSKNLIILTDNYYHNESLSVDLLTKNITNDKNQTVVFKLGHIQQVKGRESGQNDKVTINCDTLGVSGFEQIFVTKANCGSAQDYYVTFGIEESTSVHFYPEDSPLFGHNASFHYNFASTRSFDIESDYWLHTRPTKQIFLLNVSISEIERISFNPLSHILEFSTNDENHTHSVDPFLPYGEQFYSQPKFFTKDNVQIQISSHGEVIFSLGQSRPLPTNLSHIQSIVSSASKRSLAVGAGFIIQSPKEFIHISSSLSNNVLSNVNRSSHLAGCGRNGSIYLILSLDHDVYIYPEFGLGWSVQTIYLNEIVHHIRNESGFKYLPEVRMISEQNVEIVMSGFEHKYPGKVVLMNVGSHLSKIQVLLSSVVMKIEKISSIKSDDSQRHYLQLVANPIFLERGSISLLSAEDLEEGQEIIYNSNSEGFCNKIVCSEHDFEVLTDQNNIIITNLATVKKLDDATTLILLDCVNQEPGALAELDNFQDVRISMGSFVIEIPDSQTLQDLVNSGNLRSFEQVIHDSENVLLGTLPEIPKQFQIPPNFLKISNYVAITMDSPNSLYTYPVIAIGIFVGTAMFWILIKRFSSHHDHQD